MSKIDEIWKRANRTTVSAHAPDTITDATAKLAMRMILEEAARAAFIIVTEGGNATSAANAIRGLAG